MSLQQRLFHGGLPQALLASSKPAAFYREWMDSFFARDIQRLFEFRDLNRFNALLEYLLRQSGGLLDVTKAASGVGISRPTVDSHLLALQITQAITLLRPFHSGGQKEITKMPRLYAFDTGFVSHARGWNPLRPDDCGFLWEHLVLEHLQAFLPDLPLHYWRDKTGREVDFVIVRNRDQVDAIECKWDSVRIRSRRAEGVPRALSQRQQLPRLPVERAFLISNKRATSKSKSAIQPASQPEPP